MSLPSIQRHQNRYTGWPEKTSQTFRSYNGAYTLWGDISFGTFCRSVYYYLLINLSLPERCHLYPDNDFVFMQDSAPSHRAKATQNFLRDNTPNFISSQEWTPHSPDLNALDYPVWNILQELV